MEVVFERCCGLDVHKATVVVCLWMRDQFGKIHKEIKTFGTMTADLLVLHDWLRSKEVTHVAMESTGVFWKPIYNLLEDSFTVLLVNAAHIKRVPGRKTDVTDCEWIADLLAHGLLKGSFIPPKPIRELRDLTRGSVRRWRHTRPLLTNRFNSWTPSPGLNALYHRLVSRKGHKKAIVAVADAILVIIYHVFKHRVPYRELGADYFDKLNATYIKRHHLKRLESLGFKVTLEPLEVAA